MRVANFTIVHKNTALIYYCQCNGLHKKWSFPLRVSSVNVTKSTVSSRFGHIYRRNPQWKTSFCVQWFLNEMTMAEGKNDQLQ